MDVTVVGRHNRESKRNSVRGLRTQSIMDRWMLPILGFTHWVAFNRAAAAKVLGNAPFQGRYPDYAGWRNYPRFIAANVNARGRAHVRQPVVDDGFRP